MTRPAPGHRAPRHRPTAQVARAISYTPVTDGDADPGEIVWTWVPFEDDPTQGKDRPVLVVGRDTGGTDAPDPDTVLGLMLSSKDYHRDDADWVAIGTGTWDADLRDSYVRLDRVLHIDADGIRREGAILDRQRFDVVAHELRTRFGWQ